MRNVFLLWCIAPIFSVAQHQTYTRFVRSADSLYRHESYEESALHYSSAFKSNKWTGRPVDRYNAACSWALSSNADSAFLHLERLAKKDNYSNLDHLTNDPDLIGLHSDRRWQTLITRVKVNKEKSEVNLNKPLASQLDSIYTEDQKYRLMIHDIEKKYGQQSNELKHLIATINRADSINLKKVVSILDKFGWLGADIVGNKGNSTLFLVIQHGDLGVQEKYLPMMRDAVKSGKARAADLALLEDRVALRQGKKQIYGSQIHTDLSTGKYFVAPIEDEPNVNKRRESVGLEPLEDYARQWDIEYKLPVK